MANNTPTADPCAPYGRTPNGHPRRRNPITQIIDMQHAAYAMAINSELKEALRCFAMRSFCTLQEERRKLEMRPLPKPVDVSQVMRRARVKQLPAKAWSEPVAPAPPTTGSGPEPEPDADLPK